MSIGHDVDQTYTALTDGKGFALGDRHRLHDGKEYVFVQANGAITGDGYICSIDENFQAIMTDTDTAATVAEGQSIGIPEVAFADNEYGWLQIYGACGVLSEQDALANGKLAPVATAGQCDDAGAAGTDFIDGMHFGTATGGTDAVNTTAWLNYPRLALVGTYA